MMRLSRAAGKDLKRHRGYVRVGGDTLKSLILPGLEVLVVNNDIYDLVLKHLNVYFGKARL